MTTNLIPVSTVAMVKGFHNRTTPVMDSLRMIGMAIGTFGSRTRVYNLSFSSNDLDPSRSRALDDIVYTKNVVIVACAGNIVPSHILQHLNAGQPYPDYLLQNRIYFPGDANNAITVGSYAAKPSNWVRENQPSPFTRTGTLPSTIKPDLVESGGNLVQIRNPNATSFSCNGTGISSIGLGASGLAEDAGTSFSAPPISSLAAQLIQRYGDLNPYLVKALLLSSAKPLVDTSGAQFPELIQGYGVPDRNHALNAYLWRTSYLLHGEFGGSREEYHSYPFRFPVNADRLKITFVAGKPAGSKGFFSIALKKAGVKPTSIPQPRFFTGPRTTRRHISTTWQEIHVVRKGGRGNWWIGVFPHFEKLASADRSLKYGCVITVESTKGLDVYTEMSRWASASQRLRHPIMEAPRVALQTARARRGA